MKRRQDAEGADLHSTIHLQCRKCTPLPQAVEMSAGDTDEDEEEEEEQ